MYKMSLATICFWMEADPEVLQPSSRSQVGEVSFGARQDSPGKQTVVGAGCEPRHVLWHMVLWRGMAGCTGRRAQPEGPGSGGCALAAPVETAAGQRIKRHAEVDPHL